MQASDYIAIAAVVVAILALVLGEYRGRTANTIAAQARETGQRALDVAREDSRRGEFLRLVIGMLREFLKQIEKERQKLERLATNHQELAAKQKARREYHDARKRTDTLMRELRTIVQNTKELQAAREHQVRNSEDQYLGNNDLEFSLSARTRFLERITDDHKEVVSALLRMAVNIRLTIDEDEPSG